MATPGASAEPLGVGEAAERAGPGVHALRFHECEGSRGGPVQRASGGRRRWIAFGARRQRVDARTRTTVNVLARGD